MFVLPLQWMFIVFLPVPLKTRYLTGLVAVITVCWINGPSLHCTYLHECTLECKETKSEWHIGRQTIRIGHAHLAPSFNLPPNASVLQSLVVLGYDPNFWEFQGRSGSTQINVREGRWTSGKRIHSGKKIQIANAPDATFRATERRMCAGVFDQCYLLLC